MLLESVWRKHTADVVGKRRRRPAPSGAPSPVVVHSKSCFVRHRTTHIELVIHGIFVAAIGRLTVNQETAFSEASFPCVPLFLWNYDPIWRRL
jgi:hypothetical protein